MEGQGLSILNLGKGNYLIGENIRVESYPVPEKVAYDLWKQGGPHASAIMAEAFKRVFDSRAELKGSYDGDLLDAFFEHFVRHMREHSENKNNMFPCFYDAVDVLEFFYHDNENVPDAEGIVTDDIFQAELLDALYAALKAHYQF